MLTTTAITATDRILNLDRSPLQKVVRRIREDRVRRESIASERRGSPRTPVRTPLYLTPVMLDGTILQRPTSGTLYNIAQTTDISPHGIGFTHDEPLLTDHAIVTFDLLDGESPSLVIEIKWTRHRADREYQSGGKFI